MNFKALALAAKNSEKSNGAVPIETKSKNKSTIAYALSKFRAQHKKMTQLDLYLAAIMSVNALVQFLLDLVLEILHVVPTRVNHLSLTVLNAFVSWKTLSAIQKKKFRFVHEDVQVLFLMEICLIVGDLYYFIKDDLNLIFMYYRIFFIVCSTFNLVVVVYIIIKYGLWNLTYQGDGGDKGRELWRKLTSRVFRRNVAVHAAVSAFSSAKKGNSGKDEASGKDSQGGFAPTENVSSERNNEIYAASTGVVAPEPQESVEEENGHHYQDDGGSIGESDGDDSDIEAGGGIRAKPQTSG